VIRERAPRSKSCHGEVSPPGSRSRPSPSFGPSRARVSGAKPLRQRAVAIENANVPTSAPASTRRAPRAAAAEPHRRRVRCEHECPPSRPFDHGGFAALKRFRAPGRRTSCQEDPQKGRGPSKRAFVEDAVHGGSRPRLVRTQDRRCPSTVRTRADGRAEHERRPDPATGRSSSPRQAVLPRGGPLIGVVWRGRGLRVLALEVRGQNPHIRAPLNRPTPTPQDGMVHSHPQARPRQGSTRPPRHVCTASGFVPGSRRPPEHPGHEYDDSDARSTAGWRLAARTTITATKRSAAISAGEARTCEKRTAAGRPQVDR